MSVANLEIVIEELRLWLNDAEHDLRLMADAEQPVNIAAAYESVIAVQNCMGAVQKAVAAVVEQQKSDGRLIVHDPADPAVRKAVWDMTDGECVFCHVQMTANIMLPHAPTQFHVDHIVPKAHGGPDHLANYAPTCRSCNIKKGAQPFAQFFLKHQAHLKVINGGQE